MKCNYKCPHCGTRMAEEFEEKGEMRAFANLKKESKYNKDPPLNCQ
ncbi:MAG: sarcosine oxidase subunit delta [Candidatus Delongbacteria bacterium]|jgi:sarcosine oxidase delta subunit|nr:sarcosine oxidase subunit delta [Candidatus Delongbacteria bacterium]